MVYDLSIMKTYKNLSKFARQMIDLESKLDKRDESIIDQDSGKPEHSLSRVFVVGQCFI